MFLGTMLSGNAESLNYVCKCINLDLLSELYSELSNITGICNCCQYATDTVPFTLVNIFSFKTKTPQFVCVCVGGLT